MRRAPAVVERPRRTVAATPAPPDRLLARCVAEAAGTFLLVLLGVGAVHAAVLTDAQTGVWQVAVVWAIAVAVAIHATAAVSGAHVNPAITAAFAAFGGFPRRFVLPYWGAQLIGATAAGVVLLLVFGDALRGFEAAEGIVRGAPGSERSAMCFGEYFPNPGMASVAALAEVGTGSAFLAELVGTAVLAFVVFALADPANAAVPGRSTTPLLIGLTVAALISVLAPLSQAGFNPARDLGPRLVAWSAGWGEIAIPGPRGGFFTVYVLAPIVGALAGAGLFRISLRRAYAPADRTGDP